jgi:hypothetical protein
MSTIEEAIQAIRMGDPDTGRQILEDLLEEDETNEHVWLWLSTVVDTDEEREICLDNVLALNPDNVVAKKGLNAVRAGSFNVYSILDEILDLDHVDVPETTFIDDFMVNNDNALADNELVMPGAMGGVRKKTAGKSKLNVRVILLVLFVLLIVAVLAGLAAVNLFFGSSNGNGDATDQPISTQVQPGQSAPEPTATDTPIPTPADTPTPTKTPFLLPTPKPTDSPSPTATKVVPPTPG